MMQQYMKAKAQHPDAILFFRMGDFYEMFLEDAEIAARILGITLTSRDKGPNATPMAGVPYHAAEGYLNRLVKSGYKVAIAEQMTEPQKGKTIVEREVIRVVTPSTLIQENETANNTAYLMTFSVVGKSLGICLLSASVGEVLVAAESLSQASDAESVMRIIIEYINRFQPAEILLSPEWYDDSEWPRVLHRNGAMPFRYETPYAKLTDAQEMVRTHYRILNLEAYGLHDKPAGVVALATALDYIRTTQKTEIGFIRPPQLILPEGFLTLSGQTIRNLELFSSLRTGVDDVSLFGVLNRTNTSMGARLLKMWMLRPLLNPERINHRLDGVSWIKDQTEFSTNLIALLRRVSDVERNVSRLSINIGTPRDLVGIRSTLEQAEMLNSMLCQLELPHIITHSLNEINWQQVSAIRGLISDSIVDEPPLQFADGGYIRDGYNAELDRLRQISHGGKQFLVQIEQRERERTGISNLKISYNKVFGYYIEISKSQLSKVPDNYIRRQTLANAERFIIPDLKEYEDQVLDSEGKSVQLELSLYRNVVSTVLQDVTIYQRVASLMALVDVLNSLGSVARERGYVRPLFIDEDMLHIEEGRHPVIEGILNAQFVANSINLNPDERLMVLTGANMAGKSTYIRQVALLVIMAQMGSFVPAQAMNLSIIDQIHTRIGAMDDLAQGLSTFMVEMVETASILNNVTDRSLVILDEVGRGTSTYDGLSIAWAISEFLIEQSNAKVMFATHYLELTELEAMYPGVVNYHLAVAEEGHDVIFLYRVKRGKTQQSYGIQVAKFAGLPKNVIKRAEQVFKDVTHQARLIAPVKAQQVSLFDLSNSSSD